MDSLLPPTGTAALLRDLSPFVPDDFINASLPPLCGPGRRPDFSAAQLWRLHLLALLTPVHSFNLLVHMLPEQRDWRRFAHLPHRRTHPGVRILHEFRERAGVSGLRRINEHLLGPLLPRRRPATLAVSRIDATDLVAADLGFKKRARVCIRPSERPSARAR